MTRPRPMHPEGVMGATKQLPYMARRIAQGHTAMLEAWVNVSMGRVDAELAALLGEGA